MKIESSRSNGPAITLTAFQEEVIAERSGAFDFWDLFPLGLPTPVDSLLHVRQVGQPKEKRLNKGEFFQTIQFRGYNRGELPGQIRKVAVFSIEANPRQGVDF